LAADSADQHNAARLFGAADAIRHRTGQVRFPMYQAGYDAAVAAVQMPWSSRTLASHGPKAPPCPPRKRFAYGQRGRGERERPTAGWESLTRTEGALVRLVSDGLVNKDIATKLFVSPRTVQTHLSHVYTKLGLTSRVQLVQEAARHSGPPTNTAYRSP
jgi:DNA-binding CsgD family transcriptional regulator